LIENKIEHTKNVIEKELPQFAYYYGTHLFEDKPEEFEGKLEISKSLSL
jgi:hypothetical protein